MKEVRKVTGHELMKGREFNFQQTLDEVWPVLMHQTKCCIHRAGQFCDSTGFLFAVNLNQEPPQPKLIFIQLDFSDTFNVYVAEDAVNMDGYEDEKDIPVPIVEEHNMIYIDMLPDLLNRIVSQ